MNPSKLAVLVLTVGGIGRLRPAPGTWGSLPPVVMALLMATAFGASPWTSEKSAWINVALLALSAGATAACLIFGRHAEEGLGGKDPSAVVMDEVAGQSIALLALPWRSAGDSGHWLWNIGLAFAAYAAFRVFDIIKPPPARQLQHLRHGPGIVADDLIAGVYALIVMQVATRLVP